MAPFCSMLVVCKLENGIALVEQTPATTENILRIRLPIGDAVIDMPTPAAARVSRRRQLTLQRSDCVAGHVGLELRNVGANYPFERSRRFPGSSRILATEPFAFLVRQ